MSGRLYVGVTDDARKVFRASSTPTDQSHGQLYRYVIGPFRTRAGADFMAMHGHNNPHCATVAQAERLAGKKPCRTYKGVRYFSGPSKAARLALKIPAGWAQCGSCGRVWDDSKSTSLTPTPAGRCPFEHWHR